MVIDVAYSVKQSVGAEEGEVVDNDSSDAAGTVYLHFGAAGNVRVKICHSISEFKDFIKELLDIYGDMIEDAIDY